MTPEEIESMTTAAVAALETTLGTLDLLGELTTSKRRGLRSTALSRTLARHAIRSLQDELGSLPTDAQLAYLAGSMVEPMLRFCIAERDRLAREDS